MASTLPIAESFGEQYLLYHRVLPISLRDGVLAVACAGSPAPEVLHDLESSFDATVELTVVEEDQLAAAIRRVYSATSMFEVVRALDEDDGPAADAGAEGATDVRDAANEPPVIRFVNALIREAHDLAASDIHLEATGSGLRVRLRLDGVLTDLPAPPPALQHAVVSRIKLLSELDIAERRRPQDGRVRVRLDARELDMRVSTVPTLHGESVVLRLLDRGGRPVTLAELGMSPECLERFRGLAHRAHGIVLVTGPTGSGKTTTLYAALGERDVTAQKVITVEDPVEYQLAGVTQVPVHAASGVSFAGALRSLLRQDPDVLLIGEMRDAETAAIAVQAAMTGHLVFSTLHTNDAVGALTRLVDLGVAPYMIAATVEGVLAQRLVRRICTECRERYTPDGAVAAFVAGHPVRDLVLERGAGCAACRQTGYRGRTGIFELLDMTDELRDALLRSAGLAELRSRALAQGLVPLRHDGWQKVRAGFTTLEEVLRVAGA